MGTTPDDPEVEIRVLRPAEFDQLRELDEVVFGRWAYPRFVLRQLTDAHQETLLVAVTPDDVMCGYILAVPCARSADTPADEPVAAWIFGVAVLPAFRRHGLGRHLTVAALDLLARSGIEVVRLTVEPSNTGARALYLELGFVEVEHRKNYFGSDGDGDDSDGDSGHSGDSESGDSHGDAEEHGDGDGTDHSSGDRIQMEAILIPADLNPELTPRS